MNKRKLAALAKAAHSAYLSTKGQADYSAETEAALKADYDQKQLAADAENNDPKLKSVNLAKTAMDTYAKGKGVKDSGYEEETYTALKADYEQKKSAAEVTDDGTIDSAELSRLVQTATEAACKKHLPAAVQSDLTAEKIKTIVADAIKEHVPQTKSADGKDTPITGERVNQIVETAMAKAVDFARKGNKLGEKGYEVDDMNHGQGHYLNLKTSWTSTKNLPLHGKQLLNIMMTRKENEGIEQADIDRGIVMGEKTIQGYRADARAGLRGKAMTSTGANAGDELVPRDLSSELQRRLYLASDLTALMAAREIDMPSQPYDLPLVTDDATFYLEASENTETTEGNIPTAGITMDAKKLMGEVIYSYELDEDAILPILPMVQEGLANGAARAFEGALINGDTTATHQDSDIHAVAKHSSKAFNGFRKLALAVAALKKDLASGGLSEANLRAMRKAMGKYGLNPRELVWLAGPLGANDLQAIANVSTMDKVGPKATILTGELAALFGIPIIGSEAVRENTNATGVYDGTTTTKGTVLLARLNRFLTGRRRQFTVETFRDVKKQQSVIVASFRKAFTPIETPSATVPTVVVGYNYTA